MKYFGLGAFALAMVYTWNLIHSDPSDINFEIHAGIQYSLADVIEEVLREKRPEAENLRIIRIWTERIGERQVRATFAYSFVDRIESDGTTDLTEETIEGQAVLERQGGPESVHWVLREVRTLSDFVSFSEGLLVQAFDVDEDPSFDPESEETVEPDAEQSDEE